MNLRKLLLAPVFVFISHQTFAAGAINTTWISNLAVEGYDTVAYFTNGQAIEGKKEFQTEWMGANWR
ncbi:MAG: YHS domain-containing (seleno)protein, partial [Pseudohongiellaceae bacterium]